jgi:ABC-type methionine transport system permease subunit
VVVGGMLGATAIAIFLVPVTFSMAERVSQRFGKVHDGSIDAAHPAAAESKAT